MGVIVLAPASVDSGERDFTQYDAYIDALGLILEQGEEGSATNRLVATRPPRTDTGQNKYEIRAEVGDLFAQGNFVGGQGQEFADDPEDSDPRKYLWGDGFDITSLRSISHLRKAEVAAGATAAATAIEQLLDAVYFTSGTDVKSTTDFAAYVTEDPSGADAGATVLSLAARGSELFAALGVEGVHMRTAAGVWADYQPDGATDYAATGATSMTLVRWLRNRLWAVGDGNKLYETVNDSTPPILGDTLPAGWTYTDIFEGGQYVYAVASAPGAGMSTIFHFRYNETTALFEPVGSSTPVPRGQVIHCGIGYLGKVFLGGGKRNASNGYDPVLYQCVQLDDGSLFLEQKLAQGEGSGSLDLSVRSLVADEENLIFSWSQGATHPYGIREGLGVFHLARGAFANFVAVTPAPGTPKSPLDIAIFKGRRVWVTSTGLFREDPSALVATATLISSIADQNSAGEKNWSEIEIGHNALPAGSSIEVYYSTQNTPTDWILAGTNSAEGSLGKTFLLDDVTSVYFTLKFISKAGSAGTSAPELSSFTVRSDPAPREPEWALMRRFSIAETVKKDENAQEEVYPDPNATVAYLESLAYDWIDLFEQPSTWRVHVEQITVTRVGEPQYDSTVGEGSKNVFSVEILFRGKKLTAESGEIRVL